MIGKLISLVVFFIIGWVIYTQVFGTDEEQAMGQEVISNAKETVQGVFQIFKHEGGKIKEGTYDDSIDKLGSLLDKLREQTKNEEQQKELIELVQETNRLKEKVKQVKESTEETDDEETKQELKKLTEDVQKLVEKM